VIFKCDNPDCARQYIPKGQLLKDPRFRSKHFCSAICRSEYAETVKDYKSRRNGHDYIGQFLE